MSGDNSGALGGTTHLCSHFFVLLWGCYPYFLPLPLLPLSPPILLLPPPLSLSLLPLFTLSLSSSSFSYLSCLLLVIPLHLLLIGLVVILMLGVVVGALIEVGVVVGDFFLTLLLPLTLFSLLGYMVGAGVAGVALGANLLTLCFPVRGHSRGRGRGRSRGGGGSSSPNSPASPGRGHGKFRDSPAPSNFPSCSYSFLTLLLLQVIPQDPL